MNNPGRPRTRGAIIDATAIATLLGDCENAVPFELLLDALRRTAGGLPLTITVHGWGGETVTTLVNRLAAVRDVDDVIWICTAGDENARSAEERNDVLPLNLVVPTDQLLFANLVVDAAFFPATEQREIGDIPLLTGRCGVVLIHENGPLHAALVSDAWRSGLSTCSWAGQAITDYSTSGAPVTRHTVSSGVLDYERLATQLTQRMEYYSGQADRRLALRSLVRDVLAELPNDPALLTNLIEQAHQRKWKEWAVDALGLFWTPLGDDGKTMTAYVWHHLHACIPAGTGVKILERLCEGVMLKVRIPLKNLAVVHRLTATFAREVGEFPYASDQAFAGAVINAMQEAEALMIRNAKGRKQVVQARRRFLEKAKLPTPP